MHYYSLGSAMGSLIFALIFLSFYSLDKKRASLVLSMAYFAYALYYGAAAAIILSPFSLYLYLLYFLSHLLGVMFILFGSAKLLEELIHGLWLGLGILSGLLVIIGWLFFLEHPLLYVAVLSIYSLFYVRAGALYWQRSFRLLAVIFFLLGAALFLSFFFLASPSYPSWVIGATSLGFLMSLGTIILYFQRLIRERDRIEGELKEESKRLAITLKSICDGILVADREGSITLINEMACAITGFKEEEALGEKVYTMLPLKDRENKDLDPIQQALKRGEEVSIEEAFFQDHEGTEKILSCLGAPIFQKEGEIQGAILSLRDITHLKEIERVFLESERRYRSFVQTFQGIAYRAKPGFQPIFFHGQVEKITGYTSEDFLTGRVSWFQLIHPDDRDVLGDVSASGLKGIEIVNEEIIYRIITKDKGIRWLKEIRSISKAEKEPCYQGAIYDITLWMQAEEQLKEANYQLNSIIESSPLGIISLNKRLCVTSWNPAATAIVGYTEEEVIGKRIYALSPSKEGRFSKIKEWVREGKILQGEELEIRRKDDQELIISLSAAPLKKTREGFVGIIAIFMDITRQKRAERLLEKNLENARYLQESLLSKDLPSLSSLSIAADYCFASHVSGDYYNAYVMGSTQIVLVADVSGHGVDAALITVFISSFFQRELRDCQIHRSPRDLIERFREEFSRQGFPDDYSVDLFLGFFDETKRELRYTVAGSIRSLKVNSQRIATLQKSSGMPINNTITSPMLGSGSIILEPEETLLIYTDGIDEPFLIKDKPIPLFQSLASCYEKLPLEELLGEILSSSLDALGKEEPDDDMTILGLGLTPRGEGGRKRERDS